MMQRLGVLSRTCSSEEEASSSSPPPASTFKTCVQYVQQIADVLYGLKMGSATFTTWCKGLIVDISTSVVHS